MKNSLTMEKISKGKKINTMTKPPARLKKNRKCNLVIAGLNENISLQIIHTLKGKIEDYLKGKFKRSINLTIQLK